MKFVRLKKDNKPEISSPSRNAGAIGLPPRDSFMYTSQHTPRDSFD